MIEIEGLSLAYRGKRGPVHALHNIDLHVADGEIFGIIGRSGAGKSSLVRAINLLNRPTMGRVTVGGRELTALNAAELRMARQGIGMVFQHFNLLSSRTVAGNVALPLELVGMPSAQIHERVHSLLDLVGLVQLSDRYPAQISGGQKQRVGIARALANRPQVLLSDEATSALDPETTRAILDLLRDVNQRLGVTIVLITHQMQVIKQIADRVAVMDSGRIVEAGRVIDVFTRPQHATTRSLIDEVLPASLPEGVIDKARRIAAGLPASEQAQFLRVGYSGPTADAAIWSELATSCGVRAHVLHGVVDDIQGQAFGMLAVLLCGSSAGLQGARARLSELGCTWVDVHELLSADASAPQEDQAHV